MQEQALLDFICAEPGMCCINRRVFPAPKLLHPDALERGTADRSGFASRVSIVFDERGVARYMFSAVFNPMEALEDPSGLEDMWEGSLDDNMFAQFFNGMDV